MNYDNVKELIGIINNSSFNEFEYKKGDFYVKMKKNSQNNSNYSVQTLASQNFDPKIESSIIPENIS